MKGKKDYFSLCRINMNNRKVTIRVMKLSLNGLIVAIGGDFEEVLWQLFF
jgi:hypothetical protein